MLDFDLINEITSFLDENRIYDLVEKDIHFLYFYKKINIFGYYSLYNLDNDFKTVELIIKFVTENKINNLMHLMNKTKDINTIINTLYLLLIISYGSESFLNEIMNKKIDFKVYYKKVNNRVEYIGLEYLFLKMRNMKKLDDKEYDIIFYLYNDGLNLLSDIWFKFKINIYSIRIVHNRYYLFLQNIYSYKFKENPNLKYLLISD